ncbi:hypothetical protein MUU72_05490 [Streptomyces sp. RS10V-4]|uniref:hypothetical protein n=1 Tax=Streptomyces rhizoryzae TaxID=2932493 RepID=UPI0020036D75|nr:hypothetical protein [Streptomyces rhizoryzae]MCK7622565.1 hypothetical protein [Streptomyces rhizoryzae]
MVESGTAEVFAPGWRGRRGSLHAYRVRGTGRGGVVLWAGGAGDDPDQVVALPHAGGRRVPVFGTVRQARVYAGRRGRRLTTPEAGMLHLALVERWLDAPERRRVPPGAVLEAWNFFEDLARGLGGAATRLPRPGPAQDGAYEKLCGGECTAWTPAERRAVAELLTAGVALWNSCPVLVKPRSGGVLGGGRGTSRGR